MDFKLFKNIKDNTLAQNGILKISMILLALSNIYLVNQVVSNSNSSRTVFLLLLWL